MRRRRAGECMWWQTRPGREPAERGGGSHDAEDEFGPWGKVYRDDGRVIGLIQYGPAQEFPRAQTMPAGPPSRDAVIITCAYLTDAQSPWVLQSLFLAAIGECRDRAGPRRSRRSRTGYPAGRGVLRPGSSATARSSRPTSWRDFGFHSAAPRAESS